MINVFSTASLNGTTKYLRQLHNIYPCTTFFTKCVATHLIKEMADAD
jgi:hypothetical protein